MKKFILISFGLLLCFGSFAQYESFFGKNTTTFRHFKGMINTSYDNSEYIPYALNNIGCNYELSFSKNDTIIINDTLYYKATNNIVPFNNDCISALFFGFFCERCEHYCEYFEINTFFREDTITGKLYRKDLTPRGIYTKEILVCNMSLEKQDKFILTNYVDHPPHYINTELIVDSIGYINDKKVIYFGYDIAEYYTESGGSCGGGEGKTTNIKLQFIEGIGVTYGMTHNWYANYIGEDGNLYKTFSQPEPHILLCKYMDDTLMFMTNPVLGCFQEGNSNAVMVNVKENNLITEISCYVKNNILYTSFSENINIKQGDIYIIDILGCIRYNKRVNNNPEYINISNLSAGVYTLLYSDEKNRFSSKFAKN